MGGKRLIFKVLQDGARQATSSVGSSFSTSVSRLDSSVPYSMASLGAASGPLSCSVVVRRPSTYLGAGADGHFAGGIAAFRSQNRRVSRTRGVHGSVLLCRWTGPGGIHTGRRAETPPVEPTYGVGPVGGADRDPETKGSTPDDFRADDIHMAEPKEITKEKAAVAQEEPPDFQVNKMMPQWQKPVEEKADSQRQSGDKVFEGKTRKVEGTAEYQGDTKGFDSGPKVEGQYGATPEDETTSRA